MKRIVVYIAALLAALVVPLKGTDIGKLQPVALVQLYKEGETVIIVTDTGDSGIGDTVEAAFENLEETTSGIVFLDTADFLLVSKSATDAIDTLGVYLKPSVRICYAEQDIDPVEAAKYLAVHKPMVRLKDGENHDNADVLSRENGRLIMH